MPDLDQLFRQGGRNLPPAFKGAQVYEADVVRVDARGIFVVIPGYDKKLRWGPCLPAAAVVAVGDHVAVAMTDQGRPWLIR